MKKTSTGGVPMIRKIFLVAALCAMGLFVYTGSAYADGKGGGECSGGKCGTPEQSGGGCGCGGGSILINNTDTGDTYQYADDYDDDGHEDDTDNCPWVANASQLDSDGDSIGDACDVCPKTKDKVQLDTDGDGTGDACDADIDDDGLLNAADNCPTVSNYFPGQSVAQPDTDKDGKGDACDDDDDNDNVKDADDNCPLVYNPGQDNNDPNAYGDACDNDDDKDNIDNAKDNCPQVANLDQKDSDGDKIGDACDLDQDNDGTRNAVDNCPTKANKDQTDSDRDGKGDICDGTFCFVVNGDQENCLDPTKTFQVYSPAVKGALAGEQMRLRLFANRSNTPIKFKWVVTERPGGSTATVDNPLGTVRVSTPYEYRYLKGQRSSFTPDEPGIYKIELTANLVFPDNVNNSFPRQDSYTVTIEVQGDSMGGCSMSGPGRAGAAAGFAITGLFLLMMVLVSRRFWRQS
jgi:hypothetical protein